MDLLRRSFQTVYSCAYHGEDRLTVVDVTAIQSVVAAIPHSISLPTIADLSIQAEVRDKVFIVEKLALDVMVLAGLMKVGMSWSLL